MLKRDTFVKAIKFLVAGFVFSAGAFAVLAATNASDLTLPTLVIKANGLADRIVIQPGTDVLISWTSSNVSSCSLNNNSWTGLVGDGYSTGPVYGNLTIDGTCKDATGQVVASSKVDVVIGGEVPPVSVYLSMKIDENGGKSITLPAANNGVHISWFSTNALECSINGWTPVSGTGWATGPLTSSLIISGRCLGHNGDSYEDSLKITVTSALTVKLSVSPKPAPATKPQTPVMVTWTSTNASSCKAIVSNGLENWSTGGATSGSVPVTLTSISFMPSQPNWFGISCVDSTGANSVNEYADVYFSSLIVTPAPTATISVSPNPAPLNKPLPQILVTWNSTNSSKCLAVTDPGFASWQTGGATSGSVWVTLSSATLDSKQPNPFGVTCTDNSGANTVSAYDYLTWYISTPVCTSSSQKVEINSPVTVSMQSITSASEPTWVAPEGTPSSGKGWSFTTKYNTTGIKEISAIGLVGNPAVTCSIEVVAPKPTATVTATPNPVPLNQPVLVSWSSTASTSCSAITEALMGAGSGYVNWNTYGATSGSMWVTPKSATLNSPAQNKIGVSCGDPNYGAVNAYTDVKFIVGTIEACKLNSQTVYVNSAVTATFSQETSWNAVGGTPSVGFGTSFTTQFGSAGTYTIAPDLGKGCVVNVENSPTVSSYRSLGNTGSMYSRITSIKSWITRW